MCNALCTFTKSVHFKERTFFMLLSWGGLFVTVLASVNGIEDFAMETP